MSHDRPTRNEARDAPRPEITLAWAQSLDGCIARSRGERLVLSGGESKRMTHALRSAHDAILVGIGTVLADDPRLDVRLATGRSPRPVVLDPDLRLPPNARLLGSAGGAPWVMAAPKAPGENRWEDFQRRREELQRAGAEIVEIRRDSAGFLDLAQVLAALHMRGSRALMVEGGAKILFSFIRARLADRINITVAPVILGGLNPFSRDGPEIAAPPGASPPTEAPPRLPPVLLKAPRWQAFGRDMVVEGEPDWEA